MPTENPPVWFITGCSSGFGRELARLVLASGHRAVVTARDKARVADLVAGAAARGRGVALAGPRPGASVAAVAADAPVQGWTGPLLDLNDPPAICAWIASVAGLPS